VAIAGDYRNLCLRLANWVLVSIGPSGTGSGSFPWRLPVSESRSYRAQPSVRLGSPTACGAASPQ